MAIVLLVSRHDLEGRGGRPWLAMLLVGAALVVTAVTSLLVRTDPDRLVTLPALAAELVVGFALGAGDGWAYAGTHPQSLGSVWPLAGVLTVGVALAGRGGAVAGAVVGLGRLFGDVVQSRSTQPVTSLTVTASSTVVFYAPGRRRRRVPWPGSLRRAEAESRRPGPGRRWPGPCTTACCRPWPSSSAGPATPPWPAWPASRSASCGTGSSAPAVPPASSSTAPLRAAAARFEDAFGGRAQVLVADDLPPAGPPRSTP